MRLLPLLVLASCARPQVPAVRFANAPIVTAVDDRRDVPKPPAPRETALSLALFDGSFHRLVTRALELPRPQRALGVNALDEVPDSTWFTNRIGVRDLGAAELRHGPELVGSPEPHKPWTIKSSKVGGRATGFIIADARGRKFLLKFEHVGQPEVETAADAIASRIAWACGYNVPEDHVVYVRRDELQLAPDATIKDVFGHKRRFDAGELARKLEHVEVGSDGQMRAIASAFVEGKLLGGHAHEGVRPDDPNDRIPHELRRDLRGLYAIWAWLDHVDIKEQNTLDAWIEDPAEPDRHYVKHFQLDFGKTLGLLATDNADPRRGHAYYIDYGEMLASLVTAGLRERSWEHRPAPRLRGVGLFEAAKFDPGAWKPSTPAYTALLVADRFDKFWGAKLAMRFTRPQLRAIIETARFTDPRSAQYVLDTLVARQRATARYWFERVAPLDRFEVTATTGHALCFDDLALLHRLVGQGTTRYTVRTFDVAGRAIGTRAVLQASGARTCTGPLAGGYAADAYTMVRIDVARPGIDVGVIVHLARDPITRAPRIIGLWRL